MATRFAGKKALVTGAGKGIGRAIAVALCEAGAETTALSRTQADLDALKAQSIYGCQVAVECPSINTVCVDVMDWNATRTAVEKVGEVDLLVNNAGIAILRSFIEATPEDFDTTLSINVKAVINISQVVAKGMIARGKGGSIVNISSQGSKIALHDHTTYCASKGALDQVTRVMALELGPHQIRVNCVNPTVVMTNMSKKNWGSKEKRESALGRISLGHFAEEKDVVGPVLFLLSDDAAMIHGDTIMVDGGWTSC